jgi:hypothetical protein
MKTWAILTLFVLSYFFYGFYVAQMDSSIIPLELKPENSVGFYDYRGAINIQSNRTRGSSSPQEIMNEARKAGLDFVILTDSDKENSFSGYHDDLIVLDEAEIPFLDSRILILSSTPDPLNSKNENTNIYLTDLLSQKSETNLSKTVILAHPFNPSPTWTGPYPTGIDGLEVLNPKSISKKAWGYSKIGVIWSLITYPFNPRLSFLRLFREPLDETSLWDNLLEQRMIYAFAGADANARAIPVANYLMKFPSYQMSLGIASNHVLLNSELTGNYEKDRQKIFSALKRGQFYISLDLLGNPKGFVSYIEDKEEIIPMGSRIKLNKGQKIIAKIPIEPKYFYEIVLYKNGEKEMISNEQTLEYNLKSPGTYRIQVRVSPTLPFPDGKKWISWIYTNPFVVY